MTMAYGTMETFELDPTVRCRNDDSHIDFGNFDLADVTIDKQYCMLKRLLVSVTFLCESASLAQLTGNMKKDQ